MAEEFRANGSPADFHSITFDLGDGTKSISRTSGMTSFDLNDQVDREKVRAIGRYCEGITTGEHDGDASCEWTSQGWKDTYTRVVALGNGIYGFKGTITLSYTEQDGTPTTVVMTDACFKTRKRSGKTGTEGMRVQTDIDCGGKIYENGVGPFGEKL
jgi:hypothetical protein